MFFALFCFVGLWSTVVNILADKGSEWVNGDSATLFIQLSLGNHGKDPENYNEPE